MNKIVIIKNDDGSCGILRPALDMFDKNSKTRALVPELNDCSDDEILAWVIAKDVPVGRDYRIAETTAIPEDRYFRNAWTDDNESLTVDVDMSKARDIQMDAIRALRDEKLKTLDTAALIAVSQQDFVLSSSLEAEKQVLRDIPDTFNLEVYITPEALKDAIPEELTNV